MLVSVPDIGLTVCPSGAFHQVVRRLLFIDYGLSFFPVNFWYDMAFDIRYSYFKFVESLIAARNGVDLPSLNVMTESETEPSDSDCS
jgi:hypothetical protein